MGDDRTIPAGSPAVRRRRLAAELRGIREGTGRSGDRVAAELRWSASKISRYERARTGLRPSEVERLLDYYGVTGSRRAALMRLANDAAAKGWWETPDQNLPAGVQQIIALEYEAAAIDMWETTTVPALFRTEAYARTLISGHGCIDPTPPSMIARLVNVCMKRQALALEDRDGRHITVLLDESVLLRRIGDAGVMAGQLRRLLTDAARPGVTVRIVPFDAARTLTGEAFTIYGFGVPEDGPLQEVVSTGHLRGSCVIEGERETYLHRLAYSVLTEAALDPAASRELITKQADYWQAG